MRNLEKHNLYSGFLSLPEESQEALLNFCELSACAISIVLLKCKWIQSNSLLNKLEKKLEAYKKVRKAFIDFKKITEYKICKFISFVVIDLDDLLDVKLEEAYKLHLKHVENKLNELFAQEKIEGDQKEYILKLFKLVIKDIETDSELNKSSELQIESLCNLRKNGYPSTLVGTAICLGLMSTEVGFNYYSVQKPEFKTLIVDITKLARICDDIVSTVDARNLVWKDEVGKFKEGVNLASLVTEIKKLKEKIEDSISHLGFSPDQKQFVETVAFYYFEYLKKWLGRQSLEILRNFINLIND
jgi:hypothetical protein